MKHSSIYLSRQAHGEMESDALLGGHRECGIGCMAPTASSPLDPAACR
jgi:hypothetical protein